MNNQAEKIIKSFAFLNTWEEKYEYLIDLGREMETIDPIFKNDNHLIHGCQSKVWLYCEKKNENLYFYGDSDALITKGIVAIIIQLYSGLTTKEIAAHNNDVFEIIGLRNHLSMTRANGLNLMIDKIKQFANN
jgi:cysteine desulfuration protein SufE